MTDASRFLGRSPDHLSLTERAVLHGRWIALEIYSPKTLPLKRIEAVGTNAAECANDLRRRGLNPMEFEFMLYRGVSV
jgi:hypothetical protein